MTATPGTNSYVTVVEADTYFSDKFGYDKWATAIEATKNAALVSAAQQLDLLCRWYGYKVSDSQAMAFPRTPDADPVPQEVKDAQCEIAYAIIDTNATTTEGGDALTELKAGSVTMKFKATSTDNPLVNDLVIKMLASYGLCSGNGSTRLIPIERQ